MEEVPDQRLGELSLGVVKTDMSYLTLLIKDGIKSGWVDVVYGHDLEELRDSTVRILKVEAPVTDGQHIELQLPVQGDTSSNNQEIFIRAHHMINAITDITGPGISVLNSGSKAVYGKAIYTIKGLASDRRRGVNGVKSVFVSGTQVKDARADGDSDANWSMDVELLPGPNSIEVSAEDLKGNLTTVTILVEFNPSQPAPVPDKEDFISPTIGSRMIWVNPGTFAMGAHDSVRFEFFNSTPQHPVTLSRGYWLGETEVTQSQWSAVMGNNPSGFRGSGQLPVENVSWDDCVRFCRRLTDLEHNAGRLPANVYYSLPTEAQWEYASLAGLTSNESDGSLEDKTWAHHNSKFQFIGGIQNFLDPNPEPFYIGTQVVATKTANSWGFYDMLGNVREWCLDRYGPYTSQPETDPTGPIDGSTFVIRSGSWDSNMSYSRSFFRAELKASERWRTVGIRLALQVIE